MCTRTRSRRNAMGANCSSAISDGCIWTLALTHQSEGTKVRNCWCMLLTWKNRREMKVGNTKRNYGSSRTQGHGTVEHVQKHNQGTTQDHRPRKKSTTGRRGQRVNILRVSPASLVHLQSGTKRDTIWTISILDSSWRRFDCRLSARIATPPQTVPPLSLL